MFGKRIDLFTIFGFTIRIDLSWFFLAVVVTWSLATGVFPTWYEDMSGIVFWWMGIFGTLGLFVSIVFHELSHSLVARHHGVIMSGITLFIFGGVAEMTEEPPSPTAEFQVAIAGPLASMLLALVCLTLLIVGKGFGASNAILGVIKYLGWINGILVLFNLVPAFPLDGGRILRAILWRYRNNLTWATGVASKIGVGFSFLLIGLGVLNAVNGNIVGGIWLFLIGMFLRGAAHMSYRQLVIRRSLEGETVERFMKTDLVTVRGDISIESLVRDYVYRHHHKMFPVVDGGRLMGCISTRQVKRIQQASWSDRTVADLMEVCSSENSISPEVDATEALARMNQTGVSRMMVVRNGELVGVITLKDLLQFLALKVELEGD